MGPGWGGGGGISEFIWPEYSSLILKQLRQLVRVSNVRLRYLKYVYQILNN